MESVEVKKDQLLNALRKNREQHIKDYKDSVVGYYEQCLDLLNEKTKEIQGAQKIETTKDSKIATIYFNLKPPQSHERDYDQAIRMLEWEISETVKITDNQFLNYVMDNWNWRHDFESQKMSYSNYKSGSR